MSVFVALDIQHAKRICRIILSSLPYMALPYFAHCLVGMGHTESELPRREGVRTVLCKTASSPSNRRRADAEDQSRSRRAADICVLETDLPDLPDGQYGMAEEITEN